MIRSGLRRYPRELARSLLAGNADAAPAAPLDPEMTRREFAAVWLGHATVLFRIAGLWVIADPVLGGRIGIRMGGTVLGLGRQTGSAEVSGLPPVDFALVTHAHFDHLDRPSLARLADGRAMVVTARRTRRLIPKGFAGVFEIHWGETFEKRGVKITAIRPEHWGARSAFDRRRGYNSYLIEGAGRRALIAGDTAFTHAFDDLGQIDLAVFGIGAYEPWEHMHATPEQAWSMFVASGARAMMPVHHSTFPLSDEHPDEPMRRLLAAAGDEAHRIVGRGQGELWVGG